MPMPAPVTEMIRDALEAVGDDRDPEPVIEDARRRLEARAERDPDAARETVEAALVAAGAGRAARWSAIYGRIPTGRVPESDLDVDLSFSVNALKVLERRYLERDERGRLVETPDAMLRRVARAVAAAEQAHGGDVEGATRDFYDLMRERVFLPNSPTLMNAGSAQGQLSACFVLPVPDSIGGIFDALRAMALVHQSGGGTGMAFSRLRPRGDVVRSTGGVASGPVSFMRLFDAASDVIRQGGRRRGANMGILRVDHPDVLEFVNCKREAGAFRNFNLSVAATDAFMDALERDSDYPLVNPRTGQPSGRMPARRVFDEIAEAAWDTGDPGLVFLDRLNALHTVPGRGTIEATNPCGEQPLLPYEACNLGSINLGRLVRADRVGEGSLDEERLRACVRLAVRFLDDVIDANHYPLPQIEEATRATRKIGLGVMGFADALVLCGIPYASHDALTFARRVATIIADEGHGASAALGARRGPFPAIDESVWRERGLPEMRNATVTTVAPTGTISLLADASSGIEPYFALSFVRNVLQGAQLHELNPLLARACRERGIDIAAWHDELGCTGSLAAIDGVPEDLRRLFATALDIEPAWHVRMQATFQESTDSAVSKTINLPRQATVEDVAAIYRLAWSTGCKGITVFRYGSKGQQVLEVSGIDDAETLLTAGPEYVGDCRFCAT